MALSRQRSFPDPIRDRLVEVRRGLLRLHKALIDAERAAFERDRGPQSNGQLLQALIDDPFFAWLRPYSRLIVEIDEALAEGEPMAAERARAFVERAHGLAQPEAGSDDAARLEELRSLSSDVLLLHVELNSRITTALG